VIKTLTDKGNYDSCGSSGDKEYLMVIRNDRFRVNIK
jgi:hypothetical protein